MICTIYSHKYGFERIIEITKSSFPTGKINITSESENKVAELVIKNGIFSSAKRLKITYRERKTPSFQIPDLYDSPLTENLKGLFGYVMHLPAKNENLKNLLLQKIQTINCEFSIQQIAGEPIEIKSFIAKLAVDFDAILFVQPFKEISRSRGQHFLDKNLNLIIDGDGNYEIATLKVEIDAVYFDGEQNNLQKDQETRKLSSEVDLIANNIKVNANLPHIISENQVAIRTAKEIAERVCVLAILNFVAFNAIAPEQAIDYCKKNNLWEFVTDQEKEFLNNPTEEKKNIETWKCERIWTLLWALKKIDNLGFPNELCDLGNIPPESYPISKNSTPEAFINAADTVRNKSELLDAADLYYRFDWACVDARINGTQINEINPGVVYERHYALNWLINYRGQDWDNVSCDT